MRVHIRNVETGETCDYEDPYPFSDFIWTEGNNSCDCNLALFMARANGLPDPNDSCGNWKYRVRIVENGVVVLDEDQLAPKRTSAPERKDDE